MATQKHLTLQDRSVIQSMLENKYDFSQIANTLDKDPTTISKEVKAHTIIKNVVLYRIIYIMECKKHFHRILYLWALGALKTGFPNENVKI